MSSSRTPFLSSHSANALISDLRPATLSPVALQLINDFLDEILCSLIRHAESLNPVHLRASGVPAVFSGDKAAGESTGPRTLGRAAVGEAELELRSWQAGRPRGAKKGFEDGQGNGFGGRGEFPVGQAGDFMRVKCATYSTLAPQDGVTKQVEDEAYRAWEAAGGEVGEEITAPAGLWLTAILEFVCEHVLGQLSRVLARESSTSIAGPPELYVALCEDESVWGFFRRMEVKSRIEAAVATTKTRKISGRDSLPAAIASSPQARRSESPSSLRRSTSSAGQAVNGSPGASRKAAPAPMTFETPAVSRYGAGLTNGPSPKDRNKIPGLGMPGHQRSSSALSSGTKSLIAAFNDQHDGRSSPVSRMRSPVQDDADNFDALMASGETKKISLTPSRLKTFEMAQGRKNQTSSPSRPAGASKSTSPQVSRLPASVSFPGTPSRAPSSPHKLQARSPTTIEETSDDDGGDDDRVKWSQKESLAELLASEPGDLRAGKRGSPKKVSDVERTAPAVILGTPPPPAQTAMSPSASVHSTPRTRVVDNLNADDDLEVDGQTVRKKTSAQELADFLNSTAPAPEPSVATYDTVRSASTARSKSSGLRGFMSKMGRKKSEDHDSSPFLPPSESMRSLGSVATGSTFEANRNGVASLFQGMGLDSLARSDAQTSDLRSDAHTNELRSDGMVAAAGIGMIALGTAGIASGSSRATEKDSVPEVVSTIQPSLSPTADRGISNSQLSDGRATSRPDSAASLTDHSDVKSFATAEEPTQTALPAAPDPRAVTVSSAGHAGAESPQPPTPPPKSDTKNAATLTDHPADTTTTQPTAKEPSRAIPINQVALIRRILQHAQTAAECRMLVEALLAQWGIARVDADDDSPGVEPESKVLAWLLGGADGPPVAVARESSRTLDDTAVQPAVNAQPIAANKPLRGLGISQSGLSA